MKFCIDYFKSCATSISSSSKHTISIQFNESSILQLINGISNNLQKLLKYFSGTVTFTPFFVPFASVLSIILALYLNERALLSLLSL